MHPLNLRQLPRRGSQEKTRFPLRGGKRTDFVGSRQATEKSVRCFPVWEVPHSGQGGVFLVASRLGFRRFAAKCTPSVCCADSSPGGGTETIVKKTAGEGVSLPLFLFWLFHYAFLILIRSCNGCLRRCSSHRPGPSCPHSCCSPDRCRCLYSGRCFRPAAGLSSLRRSLRGWTSVLLR